MITKATKNTKNFLLKIFVSIVSFRLRKCYGGLAGALA